METLGGASIKIRVWIELRNPMRMNKKNKQDSSDLMGIEKKNQLTFKNLNHGKWEDDFRQKGKSQSGPDWVD